MVGAGGVCCCVVAGVIVVGMVAFVYEGMIDTQNNRNSRLTAEIQELDKSIEEIEGLERQKERLLARMEIIERLQKSRPEIVDHERAHGP